MFGIGLSKLLLVALVIFGVWYGFRWINRMGQRGEKRAKERLREAARAPNEAIADMQRCPSCGDFVVPHLAASCGKDVCPYGRRA